MPSENGQLPEFTAEEDCDFCVEWSGGLSDLFSKSSGASPEARLIAEYGPLKVFPCLGEIVRGHLLIAPTYHTTSMFRLAAGDDHHLVLAIEEVRRVFSTHFGGAPVFFEHGDPTGSVPVYGQCVSHAHIHVMPRAVNMRPGLEEFRHLFSDSLLSPKQQPETPYLLFIDENLERHFFSAQEAPRQFLRTLYSSLVGKPERAEWFRNIDTDVTMARAAEYRRILHNGVSI
ncbi:MAG: HIT domain-containing protein [Alphaproteobacteria bacterium]|jgi:diadenosine tetraphosphate (Ap4A) HIT family hydrolase|nr:HIT domain-containing protein [Alphaproteobacteria bacterium]MBU2041789.1 HIT domain-containing protein [Alphaproteobacteria bacterium]MBU2126152.1 HIT domain-containing protein [Alphaproteobacteria bacterium]MBU2291219.1 HIT domain-containing protein [Alphaproteobacteria bacterium]